MQSKLNCFIPSRQMSLIVAPTCRTLSRSNEYARKTNKPQYKHVLHPRTTGFVHIAKVNLLKWDFRNNDCDGQGLLDREMLDAVYDVTIAYPDTRPDTEADIIRGGLPHQVVVSFGMEDAWWHMLRLTSTWWGTLCPDCHQHTWV